MSTTAELLRILRSEMVTQLGRLSLTLQKHPLFQKDFWSEVSSSYKGENPRLKQYFDALELPYGAALVEVKSAYKRMTKRYHPDKFLDAHKKLVATELMQKLNEAYTALIKHYEQHKSW